MKIVLKNGTEIQVDSATYDGHYVVNCDSQSAYQKIWDNFTTNNLSDFKFIDDENNLISRTLHISLISTQAILNPDNTVTGHFYFKGGTKVPNEYEEAGKILLGEEAEYEFN